MNFNLISLLLLLVSGSSFCFGQVPIRLSVEVLDTNFQESKIYIAGQVNGWSPCNPQFALNKISKGKYSATFPINADWKKMVFKFTSCGWNNVEIGANNQDVENRLLEIDKQTEYSFTVAKFKHGPSPAEVASTLTGKRTQFLWIAKDKKTGIADTFTVYYWQPKKQVKGKAKILYLFDAQNLFDKKENSYGEWEVDETLSKFNKELGPFYVVAMSHRGVRRITDYTPLKNPEYPSGYGKRVAEIINEHIAEAETELKIKNITADDRLIGGSSLGGIMAAYTLSAYPAIFSKAIVFSPAFWINPQLFDELEQIKYPVNTKIAIWAGGQENESMVPNTERYEKYLESQKVKHQMIIDPLGKHNESEWSIALPEAINFLFGN